MLILADNANILGGEWIGEGHTNLNTKEVFDIVAPRALTPAEFQAGQALIETYLPYPAASNGLCKQRSA